MANFLGMMRPQIDPPAPALDSSDSGEGNAAVVTPVSDFTDNSHRYELKPSNEPIGHDSYGKPIYSPMPLLTPLPSPGYGHQEASGKPVTFAVDGQNEATVTTRYEDSNGRMTMDARSSDYKISESTVTGHVNIKGISAADIDVQVKDGNYVIYAGSQRLAIPTENDSIDKYGFGHKSEFSIETNKDGSVTVDLIDNDISQNPNGLWSGGHSFEPTL